MSKRWKNCKKGNKNRAIYRKFIYFSPYYGKIFL